MVGGSGLVFEVVPIDFVFKVYFIWLFFWALFVLGMFVLIGR